MMRTKSVPRWSAVVVAPSIVFVAAWLLAASWQGPRYVLQSDDRRIVITHDR